MEAVCTSLAWAVGDVRVWGLLSRAVLRCHMFSVDCCETAQKDNNNRACSMVGKLSNLFTVYCKLRLLDMCLHG